MSKNKKEQFNLPKVAVYIDGATTSSRFAEEIEDITKKQGELKFIKIYRKTNDKAWASKLASLNIEDFILSDNPESKNERMQSDILSQSEDADIVCISTSENFFADVAKELKAQGKKIIFICGTNLPSKLRDVCHAYVQFQNDKAVLTVKKPVTTVYIDTTSVSFKRAERIVQIAKAIGKVKYVGAFTLGEASKTKKWVKEAEKLKIQVVSLDESAKKSELEAKLSEAAVTHVDNVEQVCLAVGDKGYSSAAKELRRLGIHVVAMGESKPSSKLREACDEFINLKKSSQLPCLESELPIIEKHTTSSLNTAVFIDGENISHETANMILSKAWEQGNINLDVGGVYFRENDPATKPWGRKAEAFKLRTNPVKGKAAKNKIDNAIISDIKKCIEQNGDIDIFCIATHDKDYKKTVMLLRKENKKVCIIGKKNKMSDELRFICDEFIPI